MIILSDADARWLREWVTASQDRAVPERALRLLADGSDIDSIAAEVTLPSVLSG